MARYPYSRYRDVGQQEQAAQYMDGEVIQIRERVRALGDDFTNLATSFAAKISEIGSSISALSTKIEERGRAPWNLMIGFASFLTVFAASVGGLAYWPIREQLSELKTIESKLGDDKIGGREFYAYTQQGKERRDQEALSLKERMDRMAQDLRDARNDIVPRSEHQEQWLAQREKDSDQQRQIDQLRAEISGIYSPKDALDRLVKRLDYMEDQLSHRAPLP